MNTANPSTPDQNAQDRIEQALADAIAQLNDAFLQRAQKEKLARGVLAEAFESPQGLLQHASRDERNAAMVLYFDGMAWEYLSTRSVADFEGILGSISAKARDTFDGGADALAERIEHWRIEARERARLGIVGQIISVTVDPSKVGYFNELQIRFRELPGAGPDLRASFNVGGRKNIVSDLSEEGRRKQQINRFQHLARRAMAALGYRFSSPSRTVDYWLDLLKQESADFNGKFILAVCAASAKLCEELETRALEATVPDPASEPPSTAESTATQEPEKKVVTKRGRRGPTPDLELAVGIVDTVARIAPDGDWRAKLADICEALDENQIHVPSTWKKEKIRDWSSQVESALVKKAIDYRLKQAKKHGWQLTTETFS